MHSGRLRQKKQDQDLIILGYHSNTELKNKNL